MTQLGCYADNRPAYALPTLLADGYAWLTPLRCAALAYKNGYSVFGVQDGTQCYGGSSIAQAESLGVVSNRCTTPCQGDSSLTCGGVKANQVFTL